MAIYYTIFCYNISYYIYCIEHYILLPCRLVAGLVEQQRRGAAAPAGLPSPPRRAKLSHSEDEGGRCCFPESGVPCCRWPVSASKFDNVLVPSFDGAPDATVRECSEPRSPGKEAADPASVGAGGGFACELPFVLSLQLSPVFGAVLASELFASVGCSLDVRNPLFILVARNCDHQPEHFPACCGESALSLG